MASTNPHTIMIGKNSHGPWVIHEAEADAALTPGELVEFNTDEELAPHDDANGPIQVPMIVVENPYADDNTVQAIDHDYAAGESARYVIPQSGDVVYAFIEANATLVKGVTFLASDAAGALQAIVPDGTTVVTAVLFVADEDASVGGTRERHRVRRI